MVRIAKVTPKERYRIAVQLDNGTSVILNLADRLGTLRFALLADQSLFASVTTDGQFVRWGNQFEISVNEVFEIAKRENPVLRGPQSGRIHE